MSLYSFVIEDRSGVGIGSWSFGLVLVLWSSTRRSQGFVARGLLSRVVGWITMCRGREATMTLVVGDCLSCWRKDCGEVDLVRVRRCRVRAGIFAGVWFSAGMETGKREFNLGWEEDQV